MCEGKVGFHLPCLADIGCRGLDATKRRGQTFEEIPFQAAVGASSLFLDRLGNFAQRKSRLACMK